MVFIKAQSLAVGGIMTGLSVMFQVVPAFFSEALALVTVISSLPLYVALRLDLPCGILVYLAAGLLTASISPHEGLFFFLGNGIIGMGLGIGDHFFRNRGVTIIATAVTATASLCLINFAVGIQVLGPVLSINSWQQVTILGSFLGIYTSIYYGFARQVFIILTKHGIIKATPKNIM